MQVGGKLRKVGGLMAVQIDMREQSLASLFAELKRLRFLPILDVRAAWRLEHQLGSARLALCWMYIG